MFGIFFHKSVLILYLSKKIANFQSGTSIIQQSAHVRCIYFCKDGINKMAWAVVYLFRRCLAIPLRQIKYKQFPRFLFLFAWKGTKQKREYISLYEIQVFFSKFISLYTIVEDRAVDKKYIYFFPIVFWTTVVLSKDDIFFDYRLFFFFFYGQFHLLY